MDFGLEGKVALVTGAASGIGRACAELLLDEGCRVVATDIRAEEVRQFADERGESCSAVVADASTEAGAVAPVRFAGEQHGRLDVLILSAGIFGSARGGIFAGLEGASEITPEQWDLTLAINLRGPFLAAQAAIPEMAKNRWGRVIALASVSGQMGGFRTGADYVATKAGIAGMVRSLALTAGPAGITVNAINPGIIETPMVRDNVDPTYSETVADRSAIGRLGTAEEVAAMCVMLAAEQSGYVTGTHIDINGGFYLS